MKHRNGFVSNSSSSSFVVIGTENAELIEEFVSKCDVDFESEECEEDRAYAVQIAIENKDGRFTYANLDEDSDYPTHLGIEAETILKGKTIPEAIDFVASVFEEILGHPISKEDIKYIEEVVRC